MDANDEDCVDECGNEAGNGNSGDDKADPMLVVAVAFVDIVEFMLETVVDAVHATDAGINSFRYSLRCNNVADTLFAFRLTFSSAAKTNQINVECFTKINNIKTLDCDNMFTMQLQGVKQPSNIKIDTKNTGDNWIKDILAFSFVFTK